MAMKRWSMAGGAPRSGRALGLVVALALVSPLSPVAGALWAQEAAAEGVATADVAAQLVTINAMTRQAETLELIRQEGMVQGKDLGADLFGDPEDPVWLLALDKVYDAGRMAEIYDAALSDVLAGDASLVTDVTPFLGSELGARIVALELEARRTVLDKMAMGAAREVLAEVERTDKTRRDQIERLVLAADLIESNVMAGLNGNVAFYLAMAKAGAPGAAANESEMLAQVWSQEADIRTNVADFLYPLMALAYAPLTNAELEQYVAFSESPEGRRFNAAMTRAFDPVMTDLSRQLGSEAGRLMSGKVL